MINYVVIALKEKCNIEGICNGIGDNCINNKFTGDKCDTSCQVAINSKCEECNREQKCTKCEKPFYKDDCSDKCENCPNSECNIIGICIDQVSDCKNQSYKGPYCNTLCNNYHENCEKCHRDGTCTQERIGSSEEIDICLSLINFGNIENSNHHNEQIERNIDNNTDIYNRCLEFYMEHVHKNELKVVKK